MAQRFNADSSITDYWTLSPNSGSTYTSDPINLEGAYGVSITLYVPGTCAGNLSLQVTDFDNLNASTGLTPTREQTFNVTSGNAATTITGPTTQTIVLPAAQVLAKWFRLSFACTASGYLRAAVSIRANVAS